MALAEVMRHRRCTCEEGQGQSCRRGHYHCAECGRVEARVVGMLHHFASRHKIPGEPTRRLVCRRCGAKVSRTSRYLAHLRNHRKEDWIARHMPHTSHINAHAEPEPGDSVLISDDETVDDGVQQPEDVSSSLSEDFSPPLSKDVSPSPSENVSPLPSKEISTPPAEEMEHTSTKPQQNGLMPSTQNNQAKGTTADKKHSIVKARFPNSAGELKTKTSHGTLAALPADGGPTEKTPKGPAEKNGIIWKQRYDYDPKRRPHKCTECQKSYRYKRALRKHKFTHILPCDDCGKIFHSSVELKMHRPVHEGYSCLVCSKKFDTEPYLYRHLKAHEGEALLPALPCDVCGEVFHSEERLERHRLAHSHAHACAVCKKTFGRKSNLLKHMRDYGESAQTPSPCNQCDKIFHTAKKLRAHVDYTHGIECTVCHKNVRFLNRHMQQVHADKTWLCDICAEPFRTRSKLDIHRRIHTGNDYVCDICSKHCSTKDNLARHKQKHTGEKPYLCHVCSKSFGVKITLARHMLIHTKEKPFTCSVCQMSFNQSCSLTRHMRTHTGEKPYACPDCGERFIQKGSVKIHQKRCSSFSVEEK